MNKVHISEQTVAALNLLHDFGPVVRFALINTEYKDEGLLYQDYERWRVEASTRRTAARAVSKTIAGDLPDISNTEYTNWGRVVELPNPRLLNGGGVTLYQKPVHIIVEETDTGGRWVADKLIDAN